MSTFSRLAQLSVTIERLTAEGLEQPVRSGFRRRTTVVRLFGDGRTGVGEDVNYERQEQIEHPAFRGRAGAFDPRGTFSLQEFSAALDATDLFATPPRQAAARDYRRWAYESAALDLALQQAGESLAGRLGRVPRPVRFVVSTGLEARSTAALERVLAASPRSEFKLDAAAFWDADLIERIHRAATVRVVDLKGAYRGTIVDLPADRELYARVADGFPEAWLEDPHLTPATTAVLEAHRERITWDAPIHSVADIEALAAAPRALNIKPSRFGTLRALFDAYDYCRERGIRMYGGGQFELGPGRDQIQYLAALFHASECNDVAPRAYNAQDLAARSLPESPLDLRLAATGFRVDPEDHSAR